MRERVKSVGALLLRWVEIARGKSYYHIDQPVGRRFDRFAVRGYYNDLTGKADWHGETDGSGLPVNVLTDGARVLFPTTVAQIALGVYDRWLETGDVEMRERFRTLAEWFERHQDEEGGWRNPWEHLRPSCTSRYGAMTQGQGISVLVRAHLLAGDETLLERARRACALLMRPVESGGCACFEGESLYLEEYPERSRSSVLNGWIFAVFGLHDLALAAGDPMAKDARERALATLAREIPSYDCGYWSRYDLRGAIAGPFYHRLHIALLDALFAITEIGAFAEYSAAWKRYERKTLNRSRALIVKMGQKLKDSQRVAIAR